MRVAPHEHRVDCNECDGTGIIRVYIDCGKPASSCCGGCSEDISCPDCDGDGYVYSYCYDLHEDFQCIDCLTEETLTNHE